MPITHTFVSAKADGADTTLVRPIDWNAAHTVDTLSLAGPITLTTAASKIIPGATSLALRNNADSADNLLISDAGVVTIRAGCVLTAGSMQIANDTSYNALNTVGTVIPLLKFNSLNILEIGNHINNSRTDLYGSSTRAVLINDSTMQMQPSFKLETAASSTTRAGLTLPHGTAPTSPVNGDVWTTTADILARINGTTKTVGLNGSAFSTTGLTVSTDNGVDFTNQTSGAGASAGTLANAPSAGDPSFWLRIKIGGANRFIPCWS